MGAQRTSPAQAARPSSVPTPVETLWVRAADGVRLAVHRVRSTGPAVVLFHGVFCNRTVWLGTRGTGFAWFLAEAGFDVWVPELRGRGQSDVPRVWTIADWIEIDLPAIATAVERERPEGTWRWVGHSAGGVVVAAGLGRWSTLRARVRTAVLLGTPSPRRIGLARRLAAATFAAVARVAPRERVPGRWVQLGPEAESSALVRHWMGWNVARRWVGPDGYDYLASLQNVRCPVLGVAGAVDRLLAPPSSVADLLRFFGGPTESWIVGRAYGYTRDYGHADLVVAREARQELWPRLRAWLATG